MLNVDTLVRSMIVFNGGLCAAAIATKWVKLNAFHTGINRLMNEPHVRQHCEVINNPKIFRAVTALQGAAIGSLILNVCFFNLTTLQLTGLLPAGLVLLVAYQAHLETSLMPFVRHIQNDRSFDPYAINPDGAFCGVNSFNAFITRERNRITSEEIRTV